MTHAVYAGSFDLLTKGHLWVIEQTSGLFEHVTVSVGVNPDKKPMFALEERLDMLKEVTRDIPNVAVTSFESMYLIHYAQKIGASVMVRGIRNGTDYQFESTIRQINADIDPSVTTVFLIPPRNLIEVSSSFVKGLVGPDG